MTNEERNVFQGTIHDSKRDAAIHSAIVFLTAAGSNTTEEAIEYWKEGAEKNTKVAPEEWGFTDEWPRVWSDVGDQLRSME